MARAPRPSTAALLAALAAGASGCTTLLLKTEPGEPPDDGGHGYAPDGEEPADGDLRMSVGVLGALPDRAAEEAAAGIDVAMVELGWDVVEPADDQFDDAYLAEVRAAIDAHRAVGRQITLAIAFHYPPGWLFGLPNSRLVDHVGNESLELNVIFNQQIRDEAREMMAYAAPRIGLADVATVRLTSASVGEVLFPDLDGNYFAFDEGAQNGPSKPTTMADNPFPGWRPGSGGLSPVEVRAWAEWYIGALADVVAWQAAMFDELGFTGWYEILSPGHGVRPREYEAAIADGLPPGLLGVGPAWHRLYELLPDHPRWVAYSSSVGDLSAYDLCDPDDADVPLDSPQIEGWSSARWVARVGREHGLPIGGENVAWNGAPGLAGEVQLRLNELYVDLSDDGMMAHSIRLAVSCGFGQFYWAHDQQLWDGTVPFEALADRLGALW